MVCKYSYTAVQVCIHTIALIKSDKHDLHVYKYSNTAEKAGAHRWSHTAAKSVAKARATERGFRAAVRRARAVGVGRASVQRVVPSPATPR